MVQKRVLVTGAAGYIGAVLCRQLLAAGFAVRGLDSLLFGGESLVEILPNPAFEFVKGDIRDTEVLMDSLRDIDAVVHLAAIVGDPACKAYPDEATSVMDGGTKALHAAAIAAGVEHFVFASTCSNYGIMQEGDPPLSETSDLNPQSHYARLKVAFEQYLMDSDAGMPWTILRFATVYGYSPRVRFDLTVNHFTRDLSLGRELLVFSQDLWRPYCHVADLAHSVTLVLQAAPEKVYGQVFNVGDSDENYTKRIIVGEIEQRVKAAKVRYGTESDGDRRNYQVDFSKISDVLNFSARYRIRDGIAELHKLVTSGILADPDSPRYRNL